MNLRICALTVAGSLFGCAGAQATGAPKDMSPLAPPVMVADQAPATNPSCGEPSRPAQQVVKPLHLGKCTESSATLTGASGPLGKE
jgi:hypothetical protein